MVLDVGGALPQLGSAATLSLGGALAEGFLADELGQVGQRLVKRGSSCQSKKYSQ